VIETFERHTWPGNVRELRNVVERAYVMATAPQISDACMPFDEHGCPLTAADTLDCDGPVLSVCVGECWADIERQVVLATLRHFGGHQQRASAALGVSVKTVYNRLREWALLPSNTMRQRGSV